MTQYTITSSAWTLISPDGSSGTCWLDDDGDGAVGAADIRILQSIGVPSIGDITKGRRVFTPNGNNDFITFSAKTESHSLYAMAKSGQAIISVDDGIGVGSFKAHSFNTEADGAIRAQIQDQHTDIFDAYLVGEIGTSTLASEATVDTRSITLTAGHGFVVGEVIYINGTYKARVLTVVTNTLTVNQPLNKTFPAGTTVQRMTSAMNVDGSVTRKIFSIAPKAGSVFDMYSMKINIRSTADMDDSKFGGITALTNGVMFRVKKSAAEYNNLFSSRINSEFQLRCETVTYEPKAPTGEYGMTLDYSFIDKGVAVQLDGSLGQELQAIVYDNLAVAGITYFACVAKGHFLT